MRNKIMIFLVLTSICFGAVVEPYLGPDGIGELKIHGDLDLHEDISLSKVGHHLAVRAEGGHLHFIPHSEFESGLSQGDSQVVDAYSYIERVEYQNDYSGAWGGIGKTWTIGSTAHILSQTVYFKTGPLAATAPVRYRIREGSDESGTLIYDHEYPASDFPASTEIQLTAIGYLEFDVGETYFHKLSSTANFSLMMDITGTTPWIAADTSFLREDNLLQTNPWVSGDSWTVGDYFIDSRKVYVCNVTGAQTGTFASNAAKWDEGVTANYWTKIAGNLSYNDGTRSRAWISPTETTLYSPDGQSNMSVGNTGVYLVSRGYAALDADANRTRLYSPDNNVMFDVLNTGITATGDATVTGNLIVGTAGSLLDPVNYTYLTLSRWDEDNLSSALILQGGNKEGGGFHPDWLMDNFWGWLRMWSESADDVPVLIQNIGAGDAWLGINVSPTCALDVAGDAKISGTLKPVGGVTGANGTYKLNADDDSVELISGTQVRVRVNSMETELLSPADVYSILVQDGYIHLWDGYRNRIVTDSTSTVLTGPDGDQHLSVTNTDVVISEDIVVTKWANIGEGLHLTPMTTTERDALTPVLGMIIANSTTNAVEAYSAGAWRQW